MTSTSETHPKEGGFPLLMCVRLNSCILLQNNRFRKTANVSSTRLEIGWKTCFSFTGCAHPLRRRNRNGASVVVESPQQLYQSKNKCVEEKKSFFLCSAVLVEVVKSKQQNNANVATYF